MGTGAIIITLIGLVPALGVNTTVSSLKVVVASLMPAHALVVWLGFGHGCSTSVQSVVVTVLISTMVLQTLRDFVKRRLQLAMDCLTSCSVANASTVLRPSDQRRVTRYW